MKKVIRVSQISVPLAHTKEEIFQKACALAQIPMKKVQSMQIMKQSVDARKKDALSYTYTVQLVVDEHQKIREKSCSCTGTETGGLSDSGKERTTF